jgi:ribonucleoside-triphosphate reductase
MQRRIENVRKRDGTLQPYQESKIVEAIYKAALAAGHSDRSIAQDLAGAVTLYLERYHGQDTPSSDQIRRMVEKMLLETGHTRIAQMFIQYCEAKRLRQKRAETTSYPAIFATPLKVHTFSKDRTTSWGRQRIVDALVREAGLDQDSAEKIAREVEQKISYLGLTRVSTSLIRDLVNNELIQQGFQTQLGKQLVIGMPKYDIGQMIGSEDSFDPDQLYATIGESTLRQYALQDIFSPEVSDSHLEGRIHIHHLEYPLKFFWLTIPVEFLLRHGLSLSWLPVTVREPATSTRVFLDQLRILLQQCHRFFAGGIELCHMGLPFQNFLRGYTTAEIEREIGFLGVLLQSLPGFAPRSHIMIGWDITPGPVLSPFVRYLWTERQTRCTWVFKVNRQSFDPQNESILKEISQLISDGREAVFILDREERLRGSCFGTSGTYIQGKEATKWYAITQLVTINLAQAYYRSEVEGTDIYTQLDIAFDHALEAHLQKRRFMMRYIDRETQTFGDSIGCCAYGRGVIPAEDFAYAIGVVGLNELIQLLYGKEIGEDETSFNIANRIISYIYFKVKEGANRSGLRRLVLQDMWDRKELQRLSRIDLQVYPQAQRILPQGYITGFHIRPRPANPWEILNMERRLHTLINSGTVIIPSKLLHLSPQDILTLLGRAYFETDVELLRLT